MPFTVSSIQLPEDMAGLDRQVQQLETALAAAERERDEARQMVNDIQAVRGGSKVKWPRTAAAEGGSLKAELERTRAALRYADKHARKHDYAIDSDPEAPRYSQTVMSIEIATMLADPARAALGETAPTRSLTRLSRETCLRLLEVAEGINYVGPAGGFTGCINGTVDDLTVLINTARAELGETESRR